MEDNNIEYGPAKKTDEMDRTKKSLTEKVKSFTLEQLLQMQKKMAITVSELENTADDEEKIKILREMIIGFVNASNPSELEAIERKLDDVEKNI